MAVILSPFLFQALSKLACPPFLIPRDTRILPSVQKTNRCHHLRFGELVVRNRNRGGRVKMSGAPEFDSAFRERLRELFLWRRDVRQFRPDPIPDDVLDELLITATLAPSVGLSEPWRFVLVEDMDRRAAIRKSFVTVNAEALAGYQGDRARLYASLKLEGLEQAPVHLAVFCDERTPQGYGLGQRTMPETLAYSVVASIQTLWLAARANGIGVGWVSILDPLTVKKALDVQERWSLVSYLCLGYPEADSPKPKLAEVGWEYRRNAAEFVIRR